MTDLITRLENASEGQERELLTEAFNVCWPEPAQSWDDDAGDFTPEHNIWRDKEDTFAGKLTAHAWTSAAEMLLPHDEYEVTTLYHVARVTIFYLDQIYGEHPGGAKFVWAALAAAAVKASG